jgi:hypothetical protein
MPNEIKPKSRLKAPAILVGASALCVLLSIGLCSVGQFNFEGQSSPLANVGVFLFFAGIFGGFVGIIWLIIAAIMGPRPGPPPSITKGDV